MITVTIATVDRTSYIKRETLTIADELNARNTCSFTVEDLAGVYRPAVGQSVLITKGATTLFVGSIDSIDEHQEPGTGGLFYAVECVDYCQIADRHVVAEVYEGLTAGAIIQDIVDTYFVGENVTYAGVAAGPVIVKAVFNWCTAAAAFDRLTDLTGYAWWIDYAKDLHFCSRDTVAAPFALGDNTDNFRELKVQRKRDNLRNRQYLRAGQDISDPRTETFAGDGQRRTFTCAQKLAKEPTATVNAVAQTMGIRVVESGKDWYWAGDEKEISQDAGGVVLGSTDVLSVAYRYFYPILVRADDDPGVAARAALEGGSGLYEDVRQDTNISDTDAAVQLAQGYLRKYGTIDTIVEFETDSDGLAAGQLLEIIVTAHALSGTYLIDSVRLSDPGMQAALRYRVRALSGEALGGWVAYFKALGQQGRAYVIQENEVLIRIKAFADGLMCEDGLTVCAAAPESRIGSARIGFAEVS